MAYIGVSPSNGVRRVHTYTVSGSSTDTFSGAGAEGTSLSYKDSNFVDVYQNGVKLADADYTATSGTSIVLGTTASDGDTVVIVVFDVFSVADTVSKADGGTFDGNVTMGGTLDVTGAITSSAGATITTADNSVNLNLVSTDADANSGPELELYRNSASPADNDFVGTISFQAENDAGEKIEYGVLKTRIVDASDGTEDFRMTFEGKVAGSDVQLLKMDNSNIVFNEDSKDIDFRVEGDGDASLLLVDAGEDNVKIGTGAGNLGKFAIMQQAAGAQERIAYFEMAPASGTSANNAMVIAVNNNNMVQPILRIHHENPAANQEFIFCTKTGSNTNIFTVDEDGDVLTVSGSVGTISDQRIKQDITDANSQWEDIKAIKVRNYKFKSDPSKTLLGVIAQELESAGMNGLIKETNPSVADCEIDSSFGTIVDDDSMSPLEDGTKRKKVGEVKSKVKTVRWSVIYMKAIKALQEAMTRIESLEAEVKALKGE
jgi:hypothetical protein